MLFFVYAALFGSGHLAAATAGGDRFEDGVAFTQIMQMREQRPQQLRAGATAFEEFADAHGVHVHRPGTAVLSSAVLYSSAFQILSGVLRSNEAVKLREASDQAAATVKGFSMTTSQHNSDEGFYYSSELTPGCATHNEYGDTDCTITFGTEFSTSSKVILGGDLGPDARLHFKVSTHVRSLLVPDPEQLTGSCAVCGAPCELDFMGKKYSFDSSPCPAKPGPYSLYTDKFTIDETVLSRTVEWEQKIEYRLVHDDGHELLNTLTTLSTISQGVGGGYRQSTWAKEAKADGWQVKPNKELITGAVAVRTAFDMLESLGSRVSGEMANNESITSRGMTLTASQTTNGEGTYFMLDAGPSCPTASVDQGTHCEFDWGDHVSLLGSVVIGSDVEHGAKIVISVEQTVTGMPFMSTDKPQVFKCQACGSDYCSFMLGDRQFMVTTDGCPLERGTSDYFQKDIHLLNSMSHFDFHETMRFSLEHKRGQEVFAFTMHMRSRY